MNKHSVLVLTCVILMVFAALAAAQSERRGSARRGTFAPDRNQPLFPAREILRYPDRDNSIGMLDTRTGAIYRFRGEIGNPSVRNTWEQRVPAVRGETSGRLEIQQIPAAKTIRSDPREGRLATFLVDIETGKTWILRLRDNENGTWDEVPIFR